MKQTKNKQFEYIVYLLKKWQDEQGIKSSTLFTKLRLQKLLFLVSTVDTAEGRNGLLDYFDNFYALPYGPVEIDVYASMNKNGFTSISFNGNYCKYDRLDDSLFSDIDETFKALALKSVDMLKDMKRNYLTMPVFDLVAITHQWSAWQNAFGVARMLGGKQFPMEIDSICNSDVKAF